MDSPPDSSNEGQKPLEETGEELIQGEEINTNQVDAVFTKDDLEALHTQLLQEKERNHELQKLNESAEKKIEDLETAVKKKDDENRLLVKVLTIKNDKQQIVALTTEKDALEQQVASLKQALSDSSALAKPDPSESTKVEQHSKLGNLSKQHELERGSWDSEKSKLMEELNLAQKETKSLKTELNELQAEIAEHRQSQLEAKTSTQQTKTLEEKLRSTTRKMVQFQAELASLKGTLSAKDKELDELKEELEKLEVQRDSLEQDFSNASVELQDFKRKSTKIETELQTLRDAYHTSEESLAEATKLLQAKNAECEELSEAAQKHGEDIQAVNDSKQDLIVEHRIINKKSKQLIKDLKAQLNREHTENVKLSAQVDQLQQSLESQKSSMELEREQLVQEHEETIGKLNAQIDSATKLATDRNQSEGPMPTSAVLVNLGTHLSESASRLSRRVSSNIEQVIPASKPVDEKSLQDPVVGALCERLESLLKVKEVLQERVRHLETCVQSLTAELVFDRERLEASSLGNSPRRRLKAAPDSVIEEDQPGFDEETHHVEL